MQKHQTAAIKSLGLIVLATALVALLAYSGPSHHFVDETKEFADCVSCKGDEKSFLKRMQARYESRKSVLNQALHFSSTADLNPKEDSFLSALKGQIAERSKLLEKMKGHVTDEPSGFSSEEVAAPSLLSKDDEKYLASLKQSLAADQKTVGDVEIMTPVDKKLIAGLQARTKERENELVSLGNTNLISKKEESELASLKASIAKRAQWLEKNGV